MEPSATRPLLGRRIALELGLAHTLTWIGPAWAAVCGGLASGSAGFSYEAFLRIAIAIILADPILGAWRSAWVNTDWRAPLRIWRPASTRSWMLVPYARLDSPAARLSQWISSRARYWDEAIWPEVGRALSALLVSGLVALTMSLVLGVPALQVTLAALFLAPLEAELGVAGRGQWARAAAEIGMPWLIGVAAFIPLSWPALFLPLCFVAAYRGLLAEGRSREYGFVLANIAQIGVIGVLVAFGSAIQAGFVAIALIAQALWQTAARGAMLEEKGYLSRVQWFLVAIMLVAALGAPR